MIEKIIQLDKQLLIYLNSLGSQKYDGLWLFLTKQANWTPFFILLLYLVYKKIGLKQTLIITLFVAVLIAVNNTITELFKATFERLRPCNDPEIKNIIRNVKPSNSYSFFSGHSSNTMAAFIFLNQIMKKHYQYFWIFIIWPFVFAYTRIYLGLHFPTDILCGYLCGIIMGFTTYKIYLIFQKKYLSQPQ